MLGRPQRRVGSDHLDRVLARLLQKLQVRHQVGLDLHKKAVALDEADERGDPQPFTIGEDPAAARERERTRRRIRVALDLLRLTPVDSAAEEETALEDVPVSAEAAAPAKKRGKAAPAE